MYSILISYMVGIVLSLRSTVLSEGLADYPARPVLKMVQSHCVGGAARFDEATDGLRLAQSTLAVTSIDSKGDALPDVEASGLSLPVAHMHYIRL